MDNSCSKEYTHLMQKCIKKYGIKGLQLEQSSHLIQRSVLINLVYQ
jgi:hypothetical protein